MSVLCRVVLCFLLSAGVGMMGWNFQGCLLYILIPLICVISMEWGGCNFQEILISLDFLISRKISLNNKQQLHMHMHPYRVHSAFSVLGILVVLDNKQQLHLHPFRVHSDVKFWTNLILSSKYNAVDDIVYCDFQQCPFKSNFCHTYLKCRLINHFFGANEFYKWWKVKTLLPLQINVNL